MCAYTKMLRKQASGSKHWIKKIKKIFNYPEITLMNKKINKNKNSLIKNKLMVKSTIIYLFIILIMGQCAGITNALNEPNGLNNDEHKGANTLNSLNENLGFIHAFIASLSVIVVSELGDKTFFIAAIMAMRHPRLTVFVGAIAALAFMTVLSAVFGMAATIIPRVYTYYISTALFAIFGLKMLHDGYYMSAADAQEELEEVQSDLRKREDELIKRKSKGKKRVSTELPKSTHDRYNNGTDNDNDNRTDNDIITLGSNEPFTTVNALNRKNNFSTSINITERYINKTDYKKKNSITCSAIELHHCDNKDNNNKDKVIKKLITQSMPVLTTDEHNNEDIDMDMDNNDDEDGTDDLIINKKKGLIMMSSNTNIMLEKENSSVLIVQDPESGREIRKSQSKKTTSALQMISRIFMQAFTMTFLAEWGDRSQLTTIILSARENVYGVIVGGVLGHSLCTGLAVIGGRMIAQRISVRTVTLVGGVVFLIFAISALFLSPNETAADVAPNLEQTTVAAGVPFAP